MGTRGLTNVIYKGKHVVSQYGQWDHYPSGQGLDALQFLRDTPNAVSDLRYAASQLRAATAEDVKDAWIDAGASPDHDWVTVEVSQVMEKKHPQFSRDTGAGILPLVASGEVTAVRLEPEFEEDTLFCEGVVEVNLDTDEFIWRYPGYQTPMTEWRYPLNDLPTDEKFLADTEGGE